MLAKTRYVTLLLAAALLLALPYATLARNRIENADCTDWRIQWDTVEPGGTQVWHRRFKKNPNTFGPETWTYANAGTLLRIGVDPAAGTDPNSTNIKWTSRPFRSRRWGSCG